MVVGILFFSRGFGESWLVHLFGDLCDYRLGGCFLRFFFLRHGLLFINVPAAGSELERES
jgi:hypothetical protein